jgi:hypothetical protein
VELAGTYHPLGVGALSTRAGRHNVNNFLSVLQQARTRADNMDVDSTLSHIPLPLDPPLSHSQEPDTSIKQGMLPYHSSFVAATGLIVFTAFRSREKIFCKKHSVGDLHVVRFGDGCDCNKELKRSKYTSA